MHFHKRLPYMSAFQCFFTRLKMFLSGLQNVNNRNVKAFEWNSTGKKRSKAHVHKYTRTKYLMRAETFLSRAHLRSPRQQLH